MVEVLFLAVRGNIRQVLGSAADRRIGRTASRHDGALATVYAAGRQTFSVNCLDQYSCYLLRERTVFTGCSPAKRLFQFVWNIRSDKYTFTVCHIIEGFLLKILNAINDESYEARL